MELFLNNAIIKKYDYLSIIMDVYVFFLIKQIFDPPYIAQVKSKCCLQIIQNVDSKNIL